MGEDETDWREASDWDDPLQVAFLFHDVNSSGCGHAVQWNPQRLIDLRCCPICHQPISFIQQGPTSPLDTPTIMFKYGKHIYRLVLLPHPSPLPSTRTTASSSWSTLSSLSWWFRRGPQTTLQPSKMLVQDRIQQSLQLADGFKILHKGRIIYPLSSSSSSSRKMIGPTTSTTTTTTSTSSEEHVSELLLQLSSPSLLLMGTFLGHELSFPRTTTTTPPQLGYPLISTVWQLFQWSGLIFYSTIHSVWVLVMTSSWNPRHPSFLRGTPPNDNDAPPNPRPSTATRTNVPSHYDHRPHRD